MFFQIFHQPLGSFFGSLIDLYRGDLLIDFFPKREFVEVFGIEIILDRTTQIRFRFGEPDGVEMAADEILVCQIDRRWRDFAGHHALGIGEEMLIVRGFGRTVGHDEGRFAAATRSSASLDVVGRGRRDVSHEDGVERGDVDPEFHGGRTEQER